MAWVHAPPTPKRSGGFEFGGFTQVTASAFLGSTYSILITCRFLEGVCQSFSCMSSAQQWEGKGTALTLCILTLWKPGPAFAKPPILSSKWKAFLWGS
jgi:hypothetical protein